jgi:hypothetical protein
MYGPLKLYVLPPDFVLYWVLSAMVSMSSTRVSWYWYGTTLDEEAITVHTQCTTDRFKVAKQQAVRSTYSQGYISRLRYAGTCITVAP